MKNELEAIFLPPYPLGTRPRSLRYSSEGTLNFLWDPNSTDQLQLFMWNGKDLQVLAQELDGYCLQPEGKPICWLKDALWRSDSPSERLIAPNTILRVESNGEMTVVLTDQVVYRVDWERQRLDPLFTPAAGNVLSAVQWSDGDLLTFKGPESYVCLSPMGFHCATVIWEPDADLVGELVVADFLADSVNPRCANSVRCGTYRVVVLDGENVQQVLEIPSQARLYNVGWSFDGRYLLLDSLLNDHATRVIEVFDVRERTRWEIYREAIQPWHGPLSKICRWSPSSHEFLFTSERSGWAHVWIARINGRPDQVTNGSFEVKDAQWTDSGQDIVVLTSVKDPAVHEPFLWKRDSRDLQPLSSEEGLYTDLATAQDQVAVVRSTWTEGWGLYNIETGSCSMQVVVPPTSPGNLLFPKPEIVEITGAGGRILRGLSYTPAQPNGAAVIFIHGNGFLQDVVVGQSPYYWREHLFNRLLARQGIRVISVDYAGSEGYGADFASLVWHQLPIPEIADIEATHSWLVDKGCDPSRIGLYGGSYGGYLVFMALLRLPDKFACGAALRAVSDWAAYRVSEPLFTEQRLGKDTKSAVYAQSSVLPNASSLSRELLILHGAKDDNVPLWHAMKFLEEVQKAGSNHLIDLMIYPNEGHSFMRPYNWLDEYQRVSELFGRLLLGKEGRST